MLVLVFVLPFPVAWPIGSVRIPHTPDDCRATSAAYQLANRDIVFLRFKESGVVIPLLAEAAYGSANSASVAACMRHRVITKLECMLTKSALVRAFVLSASNALSNARADGTMNFHCVHGKHPR